MRPDFLSTNAHWLVPAVQAAGIKNFHWHNCRHTFASRLRQNGEALETIAGIVRALAKSGYVMTKRYSHLSIDDLHEAVASNE